MFGDDAGEGSLAAARRTCQQNELLVVELLMVEAVEVALRTGLLEQRGDCVDFMRFFEDHCVPGLEPSQHVSIVELISQQVNESFGLVLLDPLLAVDCLLIDDNLIHLILLQLLEIPEILNPTLVLPLRLALVASRVDVIVHLHLFGRVVVLFILREEESDGLILL